MPTPVSLAMLDAAWRSWSKRSDSPPAELQPLLEQLRDTADREVRAAAFGVERAEAIAWQLQLADALQYVRDAARGQRRRPPGFASWQTLARLTRAAEGEARAELLALAVEAGGGVGKLDPNCLAELAPMLDPATARAWALEALSTEELDTDAQGVLLGLLPEEDLAVLVPPRLARAVAIEDGEARWDALLDLVRALPDSWKRRAREESRARHGAEVLEAYRLAGDEPDEALEQAQIEHERKAWGAPFTAWRLGEEARELPEGERAQILDRAIEEFSAIALTPVSPGNDEGPFWAIARMLSEPQVRRALDVVERMEGADWNGDLCASRASLIARLALLGHPDEAEAMIPRIGDAASLAAYWRGRAWGGVIGARMVLDPAARFEALLGRAAGDPAYDASEWRFRVLEEAAYVFADRPPPDAENVEALARFVRSFEPRQRQTALGVLMMNVRAALPCGRWVDLAIAEGDPEASTELLRCLADELRDAGLDPTPAIRPLLACLDTHPPAQPVWIFRDLCGLRAWIAPDEALALWTAFLRHASDGGVWLGVSDVLEELPQILSWLAGPAAVLSVGRALARAARERRRP